MKTSLSPFRILGTSTADETDSKVRVFVVDDERVIASTIAVILNQNGDDARPFFFGEGSREAIHLGAPFLLISHLGLCTLLVTM